MGYIAEWSFFILNLFGFTFSLLCCIPLMTSKRYWRFPVRILYMTSIPMVSCSLSFLIGIKYMYDSTLEHNNSRIFCYIQSYLLNYGVQLIYSLAVFYIHIIFQIVCLNKKDTDLLVQEKLYYAFVFITSTCYVISNELTGGPKSAGPWCSTGHPIVLLFFPYILYVPFSISMFIQCILIIRRIWKVKKNLRSRNTDSVVCEENLEDIVSKRNKKLSKVDLEIKKDEEMEVVDDLTLLDKTYELYVANTNTVPNISNDQTYEQSPRTKKALSIISTSSTAPCSSNSVPNQQQQQVNNHQSRISSQDYNLYFKISLMCFALSVSLWVAGIRRAISVFSHPGEKDLIIPFFIYPAAIILESLVILSTELISGFYMEKFRAIKSKVMRTESAVNSATVPKDDVIVQTIIG